MPAIPSSRQAGAACCIGLALLTMTSCGSGHQPNHSTAAARQPKSAAPPTTGGPGPQQWIEQFCGKTQEDAELYITELKGAVQMTQPETAAERESNKQTLYSTVHSGVDASMSASAAQLAATPAADAADAPARTYLLGVYQRLHQALAADEDDINALPTDDGAAYASAFGKVAGNVLSAIQDARKAITSNATLGPIYSSEPGCR